VRRLVLDDHTTLDEHVETVNADLLAAKKDRNRELTFDIEAALPESNFERTTIDTLDEAGPERVINVIERADDLSTQFSFNKVLVLEGLIRVRPIRVHSGNS
jgi:hypothetical protein